ncbi:MAG: helix-turn-helix protein [Devosia sp.]|uniref:helix-turn-helix domain-containing protein n=1 Tax=Devosia sp. TaxID=1871048 RepID=UPI002636FA17|nr:helix-turn-helix domain-containing protein [Devosia sp.]MDB5541415.1 helix-turn-helix protein [Devosia sp.]
MDAVITAAAHALAAGDALGALKRVALRDDPPALALRGIVMARLGDLVRAKALLKSAARGFGPREAVARARCVVAEAEIALVSRDLSWPSKALEAARMTLEARGDRINAAHARNIEARRLLLVGHLDEAERMLDDLDAALLPPASRAAYELTVAGIAIRRLKTTPARAALAGAERAAHEAGIPALIAEVESASIALVTPMARRIARGEERPLRLEEVEALLGSGALVVDACRNVVRHDDVAISLATRPVLLALVRAMAEAWPADVPRSALLARAFGARHVDESHRARLRVEMGRLRAELAPIAEVSATKRGFALSPRSARDVVVLAPPVDEQYGSVLAFLADGEAWSSSALAIALGTSPRTVQRALDALAIEGKAQAFGNGRARRWTTPSVPGFPTTLLLPGPLPGRLE